VVYDGKMWVIGGYDGAYKNDVWYSTDGVTWYRTTSAAAWTARCWHASVVYDGKMWVIGGSDGANKNDVWYSTDGVTWTQATSAAAWTARSFHTSVVYDGKMWVIGGHDGAHKNDVWYSTDGVTWTQATSAAAWGGRDGHTSVVYDGKMWVIGGYGTRKNDVWWWRPYRSSGTYISSDYDTGVSDARITRVFWTASGLALGMEVAAGNTPNPTNWELVTNGDTSITVAGRYIRYRATFSGTGLSDDPELEEITLDYTFPTSLTCSVDDPTPAPGQEIGISGYLRDPDGGGVGGKTIRLYKNGFDTGLTTLTRADGYYGILTTASSTPGTDNYDVRFIGDNDYLESWSPAVQVTIAAPNQPPTLSNGSVSPTSAVAGTDFTFEVTYEDADGDAPAYVKVYVDNTGHVMSLVGGDYTTGAIYRYTWSTTSADVGAHVHHFEASDGVDTTRLPATDNYLGPTVLPTYKIFGWVKSEGVPIANAQVTLDGRSTTTDENGYYEFTGLGGNRSYTIEVSAEGYESYSKTVSVGTADEQSDVGLVRKAEVGILPIAIVAAVIIGCGVGSFLVFGRKRFRR
jgi:hypothetical protein